MSNEEIENQAKELALIKIKEDKKRQAEEENEFLNELRQKLPGLEYKDNYFVLAGHKLVKNFIGTEFKVNGKIPKLVFGLTPVVDSKYAKYCGDSHYYQPKITDMASFGEYLLTLDACKKLYEKEQERKMADREPQLPPNTTYSEGGDFWGEVKKTWLGWI